MSKLIMLRGLPASGKSTWAREQVDKGNGKVKRVNKDDLRAMIDNGKWSGKRESDILDIRDTIVKYYLDLGNDVILDDTNLDKKHELHFRGLSLVWGFDVEVKEFDTDVDECIKRDLQRPNPVGEKVILDMYNRYIKPKQKKVEYDPSLIDCYIFDIDGTLALMGDRSPYEWDKVKKDLPNKPVVETIKKLLKDEDCHIIIFSGRDSSCRNDTQEWLYENGIEGYNFLVMRPEGDVRKDSIVKEEMYREHIEGKYNVLGIFDDRDQVVKMWRKLGLPVFQVDEGRF